MGTPNRPHRMHDDVSAVRPRDTSERFVFNQETVYIEVFAEGPCVIKLGDGDGTVTINAFDGDDVERLPVNAWEGVQLNDPQGHASRKADMAFRAATPTRLFIREWYDTVRDGGAMGEPYAP